MDRLDQVKHAEGLQQRCTVDEAIREWTGYLRMAAALNDDAQRMIPAGSASSRQGLASGPMRQVPVQQHHIPLAMVGFGK